MRCFFAKMQDKMRSSPVLACLMPIALPHPFSLRRAACLPLSAAWCDDDKLAFKFTPSWYQSSDGNNAWDFNLRANTGPHAAWVGYYTERDGARQGRTGYEYTENFHA